VALQLVPGSVAYSHLLLHCSCVCFVSDRSDLVPVGLLSDISCFNPEKLLLFESPLGRFNGQRLRCAD
jgi:hypothetical protein